MSPVARGLHGKSGLHSVCVDYMRELTVRQEGNTLFNQFLSDFGFEP